MEESKTIYVVLQYSMEVPADMTKEQINEALYGQYEAGSDTSITLDVFEYQDESERYVTMNFDSVHCGETVQLAIG